MAGVIQITAYRAFDQLIVLATESTTSETGRSYRQLCHETVDLPVGPDQGVADDLALIAVELWNAADRLARAAF